MKTLDPLGLALGTTTQIQLLLNADLVQAVKVKNESPYALQVNGPDASMNEWMSPWEENIFPNSERTPGNSMQFVPSVVPGGSVSNVPPQSASVLLTVYDTNDHLPQGTWPIALNRQVTIPNLPGAFPQGAIPGALSSSASGTSVITLTVPHSGKQLYLSGFTFSCQHTGGAGSNVDIDMSITGIAGVTLVYNLEAQQTVAYQMHESYPFAIPAASGSDITFIVTPAATTGSATYSLNVFFYTL